MGVMKGFYLMLVLLFLFSQTVFSDYYLDEHISRPWNDKLWINNNSNVYVFFNYEFWLPKNMHHSLVSLGISNTSELRTDKAVSTNVQKSLDFYGKSEFSKTECDIILDDPPFIPSLGVKLTYKVVQVAYEEIMKRGKTECLSYGDYWKGTMDNSVSALEYTNVQVNSKLASLYSIYQQSRNAGLCEQDYIEQNGKSCKEAELLFNTINQSSSDRDYADLQSIKSLETDFTDSLWQQEPNTTDYYSIMRLAWGDNGTLKKLDDMDSSLRSDFADVDKTINLNLKLASQDQQSARDMLEQLNRNKISQITESPDFSDFSYSQSGSIADLFVSITDKEQKASRILDEASFNVKYKQPMYAKTSLENIRTSDALFVQIVSDGQKLQADAVDVVKDKRDEAQQLQFGFIKASQDKVVLADTLLLYDKSVSYMDAGDNSRILGDKYAYYFQSAKYARMAQAGISSSDPNSVAELNSGIYKLKQLINNANRDGIDVSLEHAELKLIEDDPKPSLIGELGVIRQSIIDKAANRFSYLEERRSALLADISLDTSLADLTTTMNKVERNSFDSSGKIVYENAIGNLKSTEESYSSIEIEVEKRRNVIISNSMAKQSDVTFGSVQLDEPVEVGIYLHLYNSRSYGGNDIVVSTNLPIDIELLKSDMVSSPNEFKDIVQRGKTLDIYFSTVQPFSVYDLYFEKSKIIARTLSDKLSSKGNLDGSVTVVSDKKIALDNDVPSLDLGGDKVSVDGVAYASRPLLKGIHTVHSESTLDNAYELTQSTHVSSSVGLNTNVDYSIFIAPNVDIDILPLFISDAGDSQISGLTIFSKTGEQIKNKKMQGNGGYYFEVVGLSQEKQAEISVSYSIENTEDYVSNHLNLLGSTNHSEEVTAIVNEARSYANSNNTQMALKKIQEAEDLISKENLDSSKLKKSISGSELPVTIELAELQIAEAKAIQSGINDSIADLITERISYLEGILNQSGHDSQTYLSTLKSVDLKWKDAIIFKRKKDIFSEYNSIKSKYLVSNGNTDNPAFAAFERQFQKFDATNSLQDLLDVLSAFDGVKSLSSDSDVLQSSLIRSFSANTSILENRMNTLLPSYNSYQSKAKGTNYESFFTISQKTLDNDLKQLKSSIDSKKSIKEIESNFNIFSSDVNKMQVSLDLLKNQSMIKLQSARTLLNSKKSGMSEDDQNKYAGLLDTLENYNQNGEYLDVLSGVEVFFKNLSKPAEDNNKILLIIGVTSIFIIALVVFYVMKSNKSFNFGNIGYTSRKDKYLKKLKKSDDE